MDAASGPEGPGPSRTNWNVPLQLHFSKTIQAFISNTSTLKEHTATPIIHYPLGPRVQRHLNSKVSLLFITEISFYGLK